MTPFFIDDFLNYLKVEKRFSDHTILAYQNDLNSFQDFIGIENSLLKCTYVDVKEFVYSLKEKGLGNSTVNRKISSLRSFYKWLERNAQIVKSPLTKTSLLKQAKRLPTFIQEKDMLNVESQQIFDETTFEGKRDKLMIEIFYQTGIRLSELIDLTVDQVSKSTIRVIGKRNKERLIPISKELANDIDSYIQMRSLVEPKSNSFFLKKDGNKLYAKFVYRKINSYIALLTNVQKKSPHVLRHTFATHLLNNGAGIESIKELLGHSDLRATQVYTHTTLSQLKSIYSQAHPRGRKN